MPELPGSVVERPELIASLKRSVLREEDGTSAASVTAPPGLARQKSSSVTSNATTAVGMGGVGKSMLAATFVNDDEVRAHYDKLCWGLPLRSSNREWQM